MDQLKHKRRSWPVFTLLAAVLCALVRRWQLSSAFEGTLELPIPFAPATVVLVALLALCAAFFALLAQRQRADYSLKENPTPLFYAPNDTLFMIALVAAAFLSLAAAPVLLRDGLQLRTAYQTVLAAARSRGESTIPGGNNGVLVLAAAVTSALSFIGLLCAGKAISKGTAKGRLGVLMPAINGCLWLMEFYRGNAANPVRWDYAPLLIAIVLGILFYLDWAGLSAGTFAPRRTLWMAAMTVIFSAVALMGDWDLGSALLLASQTIAALALLWSVPNNLRYPPELPVDGAPAEEKLEEDTHE